MFHGDPFFFIEAMLFLEDCRYFYIQRLILNLCTHTSYESYIMSTPGGL